VAGVSGVACVSGEGEGGGQDATSPGDVMVFDSGRDGLDAGLHADAPGAMLDGPALRDSGVEVSRPAALVVDGREIPYEYVPGTGELRRLPTITAEGTGLWSLSVQEDRVSRAQLSRMQGGLLKQKVFAYQGDRLPSSAQLFTYSRTGAGDREVITSTTVQRYTYDQQRRLEQVVTIRGRGGASGTSTLTEGRSYDDGHLGSVRTSSTGDLSRPINVRVYTSSVGKIRSSVLFQSGRRVNTQTFEYDDQGRVARVTERSASGSLRSQHEMTYRSDGMLDSLRLSSGPHVSTVEVLYERGAPSTIRQTMPRFGDLFGLDGLLVDPRRLPTAQFVLRQ
jgi:hypothetical protein